MTFFRPARWTLALVLGVMPTVAHAETQERCTRGDCSYRFDDDNLGAAGFNAYGAWLKTHPPAKRVLLIRPRASFVPELLKTINGI